MFPIELFDKGYTDLISVIPPGAQLAPGSAVLPAMVGKVPGMRKPNGTWVGYNWRAAVATADDVKRWCINDNASVGLRADRFPGVDIDCTDAALARLIEEYVLEHLGSAPIRVGRAPKRLLAYRTDIPFRRLRLWIDVPGTEGHLVEILGAGQQYVVHGTHPATQLPYKWLTTPPAADQLTPITRESATKVLTDLARIITALGFGECRIEGEGELRGAAPDQETLMAPSVEAVRDAVALIPNTNDEFPGRTDYLRMGYAIKAACGAENEHEAYPIFLSWALSWEGNDRTAGNTTDVVRSDWRRMSGLKSVGWSWIAEKARGFGYNDAVFDFTAAPAQTRPDTPPPEPMYSDQWLATEVVQRQLQPLRYVPQRGAWLVWERSRWRVDAELLAEDIVRRTLTLVADKAARSGATDKEKTRAAMEARNICSAGRASAVRELVRCDRSIAVSVETLDHDPMILNTPNGIVDLRTGVLGPSDPAALCTKQTAVPPDFSAACPVWLAFLSQVTRADHELLGYLRRLAGYALTGDTREQTLTFVHGPGGNGKSVWLNVLQGILGDYAQVAAMDTFTSTYGDKHTTDLASLQSARLVTASETTLGRKWDEARLKSITSGEPITARYMRQDNFTYTPQLKLVIAGNHQPELRDVGDAMRRRIHMVPFVFKPAVPDLTLGVRLRAEWPAILAWMIQGCLEWQQQGLQPPKVVHAATDAYFQNEDIYGAWISECITEGAGATSEALFASWRQWAGMRKEPEGSSRRLANALAGRGYQIWRDPVSRHRGFAGIRILEQDVRLF